ncbi:MAG TPA: hypothetical protein VGR10_01585 [Thermoleophilaceae bacterium]|nr:hypothetical protein [Thermoleophilaceae bacterium]
MARDDQDVTAVAGRARASDADHRSSGPSDPGDEFLESLMDTNLYSMGAFFSDQHPGLVDEVIERAEGIERSGLRGYAEEHELSIEECFQTLLTGLAVRYYKAVTG